ncbi:MAG: NAD-dependent malic enzyme [Actinomycetota bacterium]
MSQSLHVHTNLRGRTLLADPGLNKGTAFTDDEREALELVGLLPDSVETIDEQLARTRNEFDRMSDDLERHVYLRGLQDHNETLFYAFLRANLRDTMPIVYTPTVGLATQQFSRIYRRSQGLFLSYRTRDSMAKQLANIDHEVDVVVVTDGERILGLGDQGVGGIGIPNGKLALYSAFGGIDPTRTLPIVLDVGTNNADRLADPEYLGWRHERITGDEYDGFIEQFVTELGNRFPGVLLQWEDFASHNAARLVDHYRDRILSFNDDIEGTAAVALAAIWSAIAGTGRSIADQQFCIVGAGSAGTGIAGMLVEALRSEGVADPLEHLWILDRHGLLHDRRTDLEPYQADLAHPFASLDEIGGWPDGALPIDDVIRRSGATVLIGVSGQPGLFPEPVIASLLDNTDRPVVMPLSNPTSKIEATPENIVRWTDGRALVATGSPFEPVVHEGTTHHFSQANNVYVFPGLGLGVVAVGASKVTPTLLMTAAKAVFAAEEGGVADGVLPPLEAVPEVSVRIAQAVGRQARDDGLTAPMTDDEIDTAIAERMWQPVYPSVRPA